MTDALRAAAQAALDALTPLHNAHSPSERECITDDDVMAAQVAVRALEAALAEPQRTAEDYRRANPLGGPAKVFDAIADAIRAGDSMEFAMRTYGVAFTAALAEPPRVCAEVESLRADAARYRWLIDHMTWRSNGDGYQWVMPRITSDKLPCGDEMWEIAVFNEAIDAAMRGEA